MDGLDNAGDLGLEQANWSLLCIHPVGISKVDSSTGLGLLQQCLVGMKYVSFNILLPLFEPEEKNKRIVC